MELGLGLELGPGLGVEGEGEGEGEGWAATPRAPPSQWPAWLMAACVTAPLRSSVASSALRSGLDAACSRITLSAARVSAANLR